MADQSGTTGVPPKYFVAVERTGPRKRRRPNLTAKRAKNLLEVRDKQKQALALKLEGKSLTEIAQALGYANGSSAASAIDRALELRQPDFETVLRARAIEEAKCDKRDARLHAAIAMLAPDIQAGDRGAIDALVKLETTSLKNAERRARLLGLDAPVQVEASVKPATVSPAEAARLVREAFGEHAIRREIPVVIDVKLDDDGTGETPQLPAPDEVPEDTSTE